MRLFLLVMGKAIALTVALFVLLLALYTLYDKSPAFRGAYNRIDRWCFIQKRRARRFQLVRDDWQFVLLLLMGYGAYALLWFLHDHHLTRY